MRALPRLIGLSFLVATFLLATSGCGEELANVSGEIKLKDKPLESGTITFFSEGRKKRVKPAAVIQGKYEIVGIPTGKVAITVSGSFTDPKNIDKRTRKPIPTVVNKKYGDTKTSGLEYTVTSGDNTHNITVEP